MEKKTLKLHTLVWMATEWASWRNGAVWVAPVSSHDLNAFLHFVVGPVGPAVSCLQAQRHWQHRRRGCGGRRQDLEQNVRAVGFNGARLECGSGCARTEHLKSLLRCRGRSGTMMETSRQNPIWGRQMVHSQDMQRLLKIFKRQAEAKLRPTLSCWPSRSAHEPPGTLFLLGLFICY